MKPINGKALYTPKGAAMEYGRVGCNFYTGCPHGCTYCYLKRGITGKVLGGTEVSLKKCFKDSDHAYEVFVREAERHIIHLRETGVFFSFTCDPLITDTQDLTALAVSWLNGHGVETWVLTKNATFFESIIFQALVMDDEKIRKDIAHFGWTLTGRDDMEPHASNNNDRIYAMRVMHDAGFPTFASIEPVIDWSSTETIVQASLPYCDHYKIGLRSGVEKDYYDLAQSGHAIAKLTEKIFLSGKTVYLKESTRKMLSSCFAEDEYQRILDMTVDASGLPIRNK